MCRLGVSVVLALCAVVLLAAGPAGAAPGERAMLLKEDFTAGQSRWETSGAEWSVGNGRFLVRNPAADRNAFAFHRDAPFLDVQTIEATLTVRERLAGEGWSLAGVLLSFDSQNLWALTLTEDGGGRRYVDFLESYRGAWQAQSAEGPTQLALVGERNTGLAWVPGKEYRLRLDLTREQISAAVMDPATGKVLANAAYALAGTDAVRIGMAGFLARGCAASFSNLAVTAPAGADAAVEGITVEKGPRGNIAILSDRLPGSDPAAVDHLAGALRKAGFGVTSLTAEAASNPAVLSPQRFFLYVVPNAQVYPAHGARALMAYLRRRGNLMVLGGPAFSRPVWQHQGEWLDPDSVRDRIAKTPPARLFLDFDDAPDVTRWTRNTNTPSSPSRVETVAGGHDGKGRCLRATIDNLAGWDTYASPEIEGMFPEGQDLFCFWAKGDAKTTQLSVEMGESDGSRWIAVVPLKSEWTYHVLLPHDFHYWPDSRSKGRGGAGDRFKPQQARRVVLGLAQSHTHAVGPGAHTFWVDQLGSTSHPISAFATDPPEAFLPLETITPAYKTYPLQGIATLAAAPDQDVIAKDLRLKAPAAALSAIVRPSGRGFGNDRKWRWIPLIQALDKKGQSRGTPAWLLAHLTFPFVESMTAVFGVQDQALFRSEPLCGAVVDVARRMRGGVFLAEAGTREFTYWPGEKVELGARVEDWGPDPASLQVRFTVTGNGASDRAAREGGRRLFAAEESVSLQSREEKSVTCTWAPDAATPEVCDVAVELLQDGKVIDRIAHEVGFQPAGTPAREEFITVKGTDFVVKGKPWYPIGINFWPLYVSGMEPEDFTRPWLDPRYYDPEEVELDLKRMAALGMNMVSIQMGDIPCARNLVDFLRRCRRNGIYVNGFLGMASPIDFNEEATTEFIRAARLPENPALWAYDTIWEPGNWMFGRMRPRWDPDWEKWIVERYGSIAAAEKDWGFAAPRRDGKVVSPNDQHLREDGEWRVMVAAYRRFMDDLMSRKWNDGTRRLKAIDPSHLVSFRQGNTLPVDFAFTATPKHIDFVCPEGYSIPAGEAGYNAAGFITRYVHFTTGGKPIYWSEFGKSVWDGNRMAPDTDAIERQAKYHELYYRMALDAGANGTAPWWWPGGYRTNERSDYGITNPDGTPRPAAQLIARYAPKLKAPRAYPAPNTWLTIDRDAHAGGYWHITFHEGAEAYARARKEGKNLGIRTEGTGTDSCTTPLVAVGNTPYNGTNPPKYLNAEFNVLQVCDASGKWVDVAEGAEVRVAPGKPVRMRASVGNLQEATWLTPASAGGKPGAVYLATPEGSGVQVRRPIPKDTPALGDADLGEFDLAPAVTGRTDAVLQMTAEGRAWFGEQRRFVLVPAQ